MTEAMRMVRESLGEDAIIVATREEDGGKTVRVTAAIEQDRLDALPGGPAFEVGRPEPGRPGTPTVSRDWLQYDAEEAESAVAEAITDTLLRHGVPEEVTDQIVSCATVMALEQPRVALVAALEHLFAFHPLPARPQNRPLILVGPPGAGKTLAVAKLAARGTLSGLKVCVITTDTIRAGGVEQLSAFTSLLDIPLLKARTPEDMAACLRRVGEVDQVVIDTAGINPFAAADLVDLRRIVEAASGEAILVLPAGIDADECGDMARAFATAGVERILPTRLDVARRLGGLLQAAYQGRLAFADASCTPQVAAGFVALDPASLCGFLMPSDAERSGQTKTKAAG